MNSHLKELSPIVLFTYNRCDELKQAINNLKKAKLADESILYVFSDGPKSEEDVSDVKLVRNYLNEITGFKKVILNFSEVNKGLANSIISGVSEILKEHGKIIVLEDDLLVSKNFLVFMNQGLTYYQSNPKIISICGYNMGVKINESNVYTYDAFFAKRSASWGWATWDNKWQDIDWNVNDFETFSKDKDKVREFKKYGSDLFRMLNRQQKGEINSWAVRYNYHQYKYDLYSVFPMISKIRNIGFSEHATHTNQKYNRFDVDLDETSQYDFKFQEEININNAIYEQFRDINSLRNRMKFKLKNLF